MKLWLTLVALSFSVFLSATPLQDLSLNKQATKELAESLGLDPHGDLVMQTQQRWLRRQAQERWQIQELPLAQRESVLYWAESQGFFVERAPLDQHYDTALILGATTGCMQKRLNYLIQQWDLGVRFDQVVWLTGDRPLNAEIDALLEGCQNESEAAHYLWELTDLPKEMKELPVIFVAVPLKQGAGVVKRPNTQDTLVAWLEIAKEPCKALFVSDQPFCGYQFAVIKSTLPEAYTFDMIGPSVNPFSHPAAAAITLDSIARQLYQESL